MHKHHHHHHQEVSLYTKVTKSVEVESNVTIRLKG